MDVRSGGIRMQATSYFISSYVIGPRSDTIYLRLPSQAMDHIKLKLDSIVSPPHLISLLPLDISPPSHSFFLLSTAPWVSPPMPSICLGSSDDDVDCDCTLFVSRRSKRPGCKRCGHDQAFHSDSTATRSQEHPAVAATQEGRNKYVDRMIKSLATPAVHENARRETLQGFRPTPTTLVRSSLS